MVKLSSWGRLRTQIEWTSLVLGNGASIALSPGFAYGNLLRTAERSRHFPTAVLDELATSDFELALRSLKTASRMSSALGGDDRARFDGAYEQVRTALIKAVKSVHPARSEVLGGLKRALPFVRGFDNVVSFNYDLTLYWLAMLDKKRFVDGFSHRGRLIKDWAGWLEARRAKKQTTALFYPHGHLALLRDQRGERKLASDRGRSLIDTIALRWKKQGTPVFVSEGESAHKLQAIRSSAYLTGIYYQALPALGPNLVIYGWSVSDGDQHLLAALARSAPSIAHIAVASHLGDRSKAARTRAQRERERIRYTIKQRLGAATIHFVDAAAPELWCN